jgi:catechol 2,3-dioxygenase-like lactoylglutathione lyase family enzyme
MSKNQLSELPLYMRFIMKTIKGICIITKDVPRLHDFYQNALQVNGDGDETFSTIKTDGVQLSICHETIMEQMAPNSMAGAGHGCYTLEIEVDDVDREYQRLTIAHFLIVKPPTTQPWGLRSVWFRDPDGNLVNFYASVDDKGSGDEHPELQPFLY